MGHDGADKREIDQGKDHAGEAAEDPFARIDLDVAALISVAR